MAFKLKESPVIWKLAKDLGIKSVSDPVNDILGFCDKKIKSFIREFPDCTTLDKLLEVVAAKVKTTIIEVYKDEDLNNVQVEYTKKGEKIFSSLEEQLEGEVYGITIKLQKHESWENEFVSIIDCRRDKAARSYFTKWHEIAHLLALTDQQRLQFLRTQHRSPKHDPEEAMIDLIAGKFGFYEDFIGKHAKGNISFEIIEELCSKLCSESSYQAALIGFVKAWPKPCLLLFCEPAYKKAEQDMLAQASFDFVEPPKPYLRAVKVTSSVAAVNEGLRVHKNMRVPGSSIIHFVFNGDTDYAEAKENLSSWESSDGSCLENCTIKVMAKSHGNSVYAIIYPLT